MADFIRSHGYLSVDGHDLSDKLEDGGIEIPQDIKEWVNAGADPTVQPTKKRLTSVQDCSVKGTMSADTATNSSLSVLLGCQNRSDIPIVWQEINHGGVAEAGNPVFSFTSVRKSPYAPTGKVGEHATIPFEFGISTGVLTITTA